MIARKYTKQIQIWKTTTVSDGYGGNFVTDELDFTMWANVTAKRAYRTNEEGQNDNNVQTIFTIRNRATLDISIKDNFINYNGLTYNIDSVLNKDLDNIDIELVATQRE
jgi:SPP1 family predicted phage head-tail adaptor